MAWLSLVYYEPIMPIMDLTELRIGNFVKTKHGVVEIVAIENNNLDYIEIKTIDEFILVNIKELLIEPIPLTRDILVACCGFDKSGKLKINLNTHLYFLRENNGHIILQDSDYTPLIHFWNIVSLHQLQNLYFIFMRQNITSLARLRDCVKVDITK